MVLPRGRQTEWGGWAALSSIELGLSLMGRAGMGCGGRGWRALADFCSGAPNSALCCLGSDVGADILGRCLPFEVLMLSMSENGKLPVRRPPLAWAQPVVNCRRKRKAARKRPHAWGWTQMESDRRGSSLDERLNLSPAFPPRGPRWNAGGLGECRARSGMLGSNRRDGIRRRMRDIFFRRKARRGQAARRLAWREPGPRRKRAQPHRILQIAERCFAG